MNNDKVRTAFINGLTLGILIGAGVILFCIYLGVKTGMVIVL